MKAAKTVSPDKLIDGIAFVKADANRFGAVIPMNDREYWELCGSAFMDYFSRVQWGTSERYGWQTVKVDGLNNLKIWKL